jgi:hypothetical protein
MVHGFAQQSSGHVVIKSTVGKGTAVTLILPRGELATGAQVRRDKGGKMAEGRERILVVEDEQDVRRYVSSQLESFGYDVVEASTGAAVARDARPRRNHRAPIHRRGATGRNERRGASRAGA